MHCCQPQQTLLVLLHVSVILTILRREIHNTLFKTGNKIHIYIKFVRSHKLYKS